MRSHKKLAATVFVLAMGALLPHVAHADPAPSIADEVEAFAAIGVPALAPVVNFGVMVFAWINTGANVTEIPGGFTTTGARRSFLVENDGTLDVTLGGGAGVTANQGNPNAGGVLAWPVQGASANHAALDPNPLVIGAWDPNNARTQQLTVDTQANLSVAVTDAGGNSVYPWETTGSTFPAAVVVIGGSNGAASPLVKQLTVGASGTAFTGTTPNVLMIGGMDGTATNGVPRVLTVEPAGATMTGVPNSIVVSGLTANSGGIVYGLHVAPASGNFNPGALNVYDVTDMAIALGAPTNTALTANTSVKAGTVSPGLCWKLVCAVDITYRITNGASTALNTDFYLPAKTTITECSPAVAQTDLTVLPSASSSASGASFGGCAFDSLQSPP